jgi:hypothetical protein
MLAARHPGTLTARERSTTTSECRRKLRDVILMTPDAERTPARRKNTQRRCRSSSSSSSRQAKPSPAPSARQAQGKRGPFHGWIAFMSALNTLRDTDPRVEPSD